MKDWPVKKLGEVCSVIIGGTPRRGVEKYWKNGTLTWVSISDLNNDVITHTKEKITELGAKESNVKLIPRRTLLFSFKLTIGKMGIAGSDLYTNEAIAALPIKNKSELIQEYLLYFLQQATFETAHLAVKGKTLNKKKLENLEIPVPGIKEQRRIVKKLEKILEKIEEAKNLQSEVHKELDDLTSSVLNKAFTGNL